MPLSKYMRVGIEDEDLDLFSLQEVPISISYHLEDSENFQQKRSSELFSLRVPATGNNDRISNTFHNPAIDDRTPNTSYRNYRRAFVEANSIELLVGKTILTSARHARTPLDYMYDFYGNNGDWIIPLQESTLYDFLKDISFTFTKQRIIDSWAFDGTDEDLPYVFAPVRYGQAMDDYVPLTGEPVKDHNMKPEYMKPALSKYWILYKAFKSLGYKISSTYLDTEHFRRQTMPWTWGNFLFSEGTRLNDLDFLAKSTETVSLINQDFTGFVDVKASNDISNGGFDNNGVYNYDAVNFEMEWTYLPAMNYGSLEATFHFNMFIQAVVTANSDAEVRIQWFKNGVRIPNGNDNGNGTLLMEINAPTIGRRDFSGPVDDFFTIVVDPGDEIKCKIFAHTFDSGTGISRVHMTVDAFELDYFRIPLGGIIDFANYTAFKKYKVLDFLRGLIDEFNLAIQTDPINKVVTIEPLHPYSLTDDQSDKSGGYLNGDFLDWNQKQDLSKESELFLYSDSERELLYHYKDDRNDGILKVVQDRFVNRLATGKYVLPDRFQTGKKDAVENRFFSPLMHYDVEQWKGLGSDPDMAPQMICLVPENISNTSREEAQNTFEPKSAYYKGLVNDVGWVFDNEELDEYPFMFAVNYKPGGEDDPILSYSDERIGTDPYVVGKGLLKRFYWQRMAIMRNGQYYNTLFHLRNIDISNYLHRGNLLYLHLFDFSGSMLRLVP